MAPNNAYRTHLLRSVDLAVGPDILLVYSSEL